MSFWDDVSNVVSAPVNAIGTAIQHPSLGTIGNALNPLGSMVGALNPPKPGPSSPTPLALGQLGGTPKLTPKPGASTYDPGPAAQTFQSPGQVSGWTGVSSNEDPYGIKNIGYTLPAGVSRSELLSLNSPQINQAVAPTGPSMYENQNALDGSALGPDSQRIATQQQNAQSNVQNMQSQYPAFSNSYGIGGSISPASASSYSGQGVTVNVPDTASRGFNPWSLQGESNARDTQKGVI